MNISVCCCGEKKRAHQGGRAASLLTTKSSIYYYITYRGEISRDTLYSVEERRYCFLWILPHRSPPRQALWSGAVRAGVIYRRDYRSDLMVSTALLCALRLNGAWKEVRSRVCVCVCQQMPLESQHSPIVLKKCI